MEKKTLLTLGIGLGTIAATTFGIMVATSVSAGEDASGKVFENDFISFNTADVISVQAIVDSDQVSHSYNTGTTQLHIQ